MAAVRGAMSGGGSIMRLCLSIIIVQGGNANTSANTYITTAYYC
jgi:hypothetical protein